MLIELKKIHDKNKYEVYYKVGEVYVFKVIVIPSRGEENECSFVQWFNMNIGWIEIFRDFKKGFTEEDIKDMVLFCEQILDNCKSNLWPRTT